MALSDNGGGSLVTRMHRKEGSLAEQNPWDTMIGCGTNGKRCEIVCEKRPIVGTFLPVACIFCQLSFSVETSDIMNLKTGAVTRTMSCLA